MWGTFLSEPLSIVGLVGRYPANCLMERMPIYQRWIFSKYPHAGPLLHAVLVRLSPGYPPLIGKLHTRYSPVRRSPAGIATPAAPRLACVKPVASVHPEPGSNSSLLKLFYIFAQNLVFIVVFDGMFRISIRLLYYLLICNIFKELIAIVSIAAAKVRTFFKLTNFLEENLKSFFRNPPGGRTSRLASLTSSFPITVTYFASCQSRPLSLECGCKSRTKISFMQMFGKVFYIFFYSEEWILYGTHMREVIQHFLQ